MSSRVRGGVLVACALAMASCGDDPSARDEPIRVGVIVSLSGELAAVGDHLANSARLAARDINAAGGLLGGRQVELIVVDDRTDPAQARRVADELIAQGVVAIIGSLSSAATDQVQMVTAAARIPQISCCSTSQRLTDAQPAEDRFLFRTAPSDTVQARVVAKVANDNLCERLAILHIADSYGEPFAEGIQQAVSGGATRVVEVVPFQGGRSTYTDEVESVATANPDCVVLVAFPEDGGTLMREWNNLATPPPVLFIGTDGVKDPGFPDAAGSNAFVDGVIGTAPIVEPETPAANAFIASYRVSFGARPGIFGGNQYDAMALLGLAIQKAGTTDGEAVREALLLVANPNDGDERIIPGEMAQALGLLAEPGGDVDYEGASGSVNLDALGDVTSDYEVWRYDAATDSFIQIDTVTEPELDP